MQIQLVSEEGLNRGFDVTVPATDFETRVDTNLAGFAKDLKLPGFRPGKVPQADPPSLPRFHYGRGDE